MLRRDLLGLLAAPFVRWRNFFAGTPAGAAIADAGNAAPLYEEAFRRLERVVEGHKTLLRNRATWLAADLTDEQATRLLDDAKPTLDALRAASRLGDCRWEPARITHEDLLKGRLDPAHGRVVDLLDLSAERHARVGDFRAMRGDIDAALTLARRLAADGILMARLLGYSCEVGTWQAFGRIVPLLDRTTCDDLAGWVDELPAPEPASAVVAPEARFILDSTRARLAEPGPALIDEAGWVKFWVHPEDRPALTRITGGEPARLLTHLEASEPAYRKLARRLDLTRPDVWAGLAQFEAEHAATFPIAARLVDPFRGVRHNRHRIEATRALARAGLILRGQGEAAFEALADPFGVDGAGFGREPVGRATVLRSALRDDWRPAVELTIGAP